MENVMNKAWVTLTPGYVTILVTMSSKKPLDRAPVMWSIDVCIVVYRNGQLTTQIISQWN